MRTFLFELMVVWTASLLIACAGQPTAPPPGAQGCNPAIDRAVASGDWQTALADHERLLTRRPNDCLAVYHLGYIWGQLGDRAKEIHYYKQAVECGYDRDDLLYFNLGMAELDLGDLDGALAAFEEAARINPDNADSYFGQGIIFQASGRSMEAEQAWLHALEIDPRHRESHLALARLYLDQSRWEKARVQLDALRAIDPENAEAQELRELLESRRALEY